MWFEKEKLSNAPSLMLLSSFFFLFFFFFCIGHHKKFFFPEKQWFFRLNYMPWKYKRKTCRKHVFATWILFIYFMAKSVVGFFSSVHFLMILSLCNGLQTSINYCRSECDSLSDSTHTPPVSDHLELKPLHKIEASDDLWFFSSGTGNCSPNAVRCTGGSAEISLRFPACRSVRPPYVRCRVSVCCALLPPACLLRHIQLTGVFLCLHVEMLSCSSFYCQPVHVVFILFFFISWGQHCLLQPKKDQLFISFKYIIVTYPGAKNTTSE